ncbi:MAG: hypothetical protein WED32_02020, partial [Patescibacteria group bacterium]
MVRLVTAEDTTQPEHHPQPSRHHHRQWWKVPLLLFFSVAFLGSGWFTYKVSAATDRIFTENVGGQQVLQQDLKGGDRVNVLLI